MNKRELDEIRAALKMQECETNYITEGRRAASLIRDIPKLLDHIEAVQRRSDWLSERYRWFTGRPGGSPDPNWHRARVCAKCGTLHRVIDGKWVGKHTDGCTIAKEGR